TSAVEPDLQVPAGEMDDDLAVAVRRSRDRHGARTRRTRLPHAPFPDARGDPAGPIDTCDLDVRACGKARIRLERRPDRGQVSRVAHDHGVWVADVDRNEADAV